MAQQNGANVLGIDFGTSNSAAGICVDGKPVLIEVEPDAQTLPTSIFFDFEERRSSFGTQANQALIEGLDGRFMRSLKSVLGTSLMHEKRRYMGETLSFVDIIARFLAAVKSRAEASCGREFDYALSGRPVHFHSDDPAKDKQALTDLQACYARAGFKDVAFMFEPEAAALAANPAGDSETLHLIVDIGGGTSDFTVFRKSDTGIDILASHGVRIGGTNFDRSISFDHVMPLFGKGSLIRDAFGPGTLPAPNKLFHDLATWQMIPFLYTREVKQTVMQLKQQAQQPALFSRLLEVLDNQLGHDVAFGVEAGKISANKALEPVAQIDLAIVEAGLAAGLTQAGLSSSLQPHMDGISKGAVETLDMAHCKAEDIGTVIFVGGSSLMLDVQHAMAKLFPTADMQHTEAFTAVVDGLVLAAGNTQFG